MPAGVTKHFDEQVRAAVDDLRRVVEIRYSIDHPEQPDDEVDTVKRAKCVAHGGKQSESDQPSAPIAFLDADLGAELAGQRCSLIVARALAGEKQQIAC